MRIGRALPMIALALAACAQVREPSGGVKDTQAPRLVDAEPADGSTGFTGDRILLHFDERVRLDRASDKLLISPPLKAKPDVRMAGADGVLIELRAPLESNTTYLFNLEDAIADLSEGNRANGLVYVISTGDHIDSLMVRGRVRDAMTDEAAKDIIVMLYSPENDSGFTRGGPDYFTRTRADGSFKLEHLRAGSYSLHALFDQNGNHRYDLPNESIAFLANTVEPQANDSTIYDLALFREAPDAQAVLGARTTADAALRVALARPAGELALANVAWSGGTLTWIEERNPTGDTILFWPSDTALLEGRAFSFLENGAVLDTVRYERREKMPFNVGVSLGWNVDGATTSYHLRTSRPIARIDSTRMMAQGKEGMPIALPSMAVEGDRRTIAIGATEPGEVRLTLLPGAITDLYGGSHDTLRFQLRPDVVSESGALKVKVSGAFGEHPILRLLGSQDRVLRKIALPPTGGTIQWELVPPGNYALTLFNDADNNGRWTTGELAARNQPESAWRYPGTVTVRAGWDVEVEWKAGK